MQRLLIALLLIFCTLLPQAALADGPSGRGWWITSDPSTIQNPEAGKTVVFNTTLNSLQFYNGSAFQPLGAPASTFTATSAPGINNDSTQGYSVGSMWIDQTHGTQWVCLDATAGAAVWQNLLGGALKLTTGDWLSDFLVSGCNGSVPTTSLSMTTPAGVAYVGGLRITPAASTYTYPVSSDVYDYLQSDGSWLHVAVSNGGSAPTGQPGLLIQKVITDPSVITGVTAIASHLPTISVPTATASGHALNLGQANALYSPLSLYSAPGDLVYGTGVGTVAKLPVGASGTLLGSISGLPGYVTLLPGANVTVDTSVPGQITLGATGGAGGSIVGPLGAFQSTTFSAYTTSGGGDLVITSDGKYIFAMCADQATGANQYVIKVEKATGNLLAAQLVQSAASGYDIYLSPDESTVYVVTDDGTTSEVSKLSASTLAVSATCTLSTSSGGVGSSDLSPDGTKLAVQAFDGATGKVYIVDTAAMTATSWTPDIAPEGGICFAYQDNAHVWVGGTSATGNIKKYDLSGTGSTVIGTGVANSWVVLRMDHSSDANDLNKGYLFAAGIGATIDVYVYDTVGAAFVADKTMPTDSNVIRHMKVFPANDNRDNTRLGVYGIPNYNKQMVVVGKQYNRLGTAESAVTIEAYDFTGGSFIDLNWQGCAMDPTNATVYTTRTDNSTGYLAIEGLALNVASKVHPPGDNYLQVSSKGQWAPQDASTTRSILGAAASGANGDITSITSINTIRMLEVAAPAAPASGFILYVDNSDHTLKAKSSGGTVTNLALP